MFPIILVACGSVIVLCMLYLWYRDIKDSLIPPR